MVSIFNISLIKITLNMSSNIHGKSISKVAVLIKKLKINNFLCLFNFMPDAMVCARGTYIFLKPQQKYLLLFPLLYPNYPQISAQMLLSQKDLSEQSSLPLPSFLKPYSFLYTYYNFYYAIGCLSLPLDYFHLFTHHSFKRSLLRTQEVSGTLRCTS